MGTKLSWKKCQIETTKVDFLGFTFSKEQCIPQDSKIQAIQEWKVPTKLKELQSFLGFINFYRTFIPNLAEITRPLYELLQKDKKFEWTPERETTFQNLKKVITSNTVLRTPNDYFPFIVEVDTSGYAVGAALSQRNHLEKKPRPIAFFSKSLSPAQQNYGAAK